MHAFMLFVSTPLVMDVSMTRYSMLSQTWAGVCTWSVFNHI